jgi:putative transposase
MNEPVHAASFTRTLRLKVKAESYPWLNAAAVEVNQVFNWANETSAKAARPFACKPKWLSGFDLCYLSTGATKFFEKIGADTVQRICTEYAAKRRAAKRVRLRWRVSRGARRSLGWVPLKAASLKRRGSALRFCGKTFRVFERERLEGVKWRDGCFAQDAVGDWWLCLPVEIAVEQKDAPLQAVGIDLGLKEIAVTSAGERLEAGRWTHGLADKLAMAQRRGHKRQAKRIHRKAARQRAEALHKFSRKMVDQYQNIDTTRACSGCGSLTGPTGASMLVVRRWVCRACGDTHDRDVNAARNILAGSRCLTSVRGNESSDSSVPLSRLRKRRRETGTETMKTAA